MQTDKLNHSHIFSHIRESCSDFLSQMSGVPVYRTSTFCGAAKRVKLRFRQSTDLAPLLGEIAESIVHTPQFSGKTVVGYSSSPPPLTANHEMYYLFVPNGFRCMFSNEFVDSKAAFSNMEDDVSKLLPVGSRELLTDIVSLSYEVQTSVASLRQKYTEIAFFRIPHFYVVHTAGFETYEELHELIGRS